MTNVIYYTSNIIGRLTGIQPICWIGYTEGAEDTFMRILILFIDYHQISS